MSYRRIDVSEFSKICRLCLSQTTELQSLFDSNVDNGSSTSIQSKINHNLTIQVSVEDSLPDHICHNCCQRIDEWHLYKGMCVENDSILRKCIQSVKKFSDQNSSLQDKIENASINSLIEREDLESIVQIYVEVPDVGAKKQEAIENVEKDSNGFILLVVQEEGLDSNKTPESLEAASVYFNDEDAITEPENAHCTVQDNTGIGGLSASAVSPAEMVKHLSCQFCDKVFSRYNNRMVHEKKYHKSKTTSAELEDNTISSGKYVCRICGKNFSRIDYLKTHEIRVHSVERPFRCDCGLGFVRKHDMLWHQNTHVKGDETCEKTLLHSSPKTHSCYFCSITFPKLESLIFHFESEHMDDEFRCTLCDTKFLDKKELLWHRNEMDKIGSDNEACEDKFSLLLLQQGAENKCNIATEADACKGQYKCTLCNHLFFDINLCKLHVFRIHSSFENFNCTSCSETFSNKCHLFLHECKQENNSNLNITENPFTFSHLDQNYKIGGATSLEYKKGSSSRNPIRKKPTPSDEHSYVYSKPKQKEEGRLFYCICCAREFSTLEAVCAHEKREGNRKSHKCNECGKTFCNPSALRVHSIIHTGVKPHTCDVCQLTFRTLSNLNAHKKRHSEEPCFVCNTCGKQFLTVSGLRRHEILHIGERKYNCKICEKAFFTREERNRHIKYHSGEKKFICEHCGKRFFESSHLRMHSRSHINDKSFYCLSCNLSFESFTHLKTHENTELHLQKLSLIPSSKHDVTEHWDSSIGDHREHGVSDFDICKGVCEGDAFPSEYLS